MSTVASVKRLARATVNLKAETVDTAGAPIGEFDATVAVFDNVDYQNDVLEPTAFDASLKSWQDRYNGAGEGAGEPIPVIWSHMWDDPFAHIGFVDPNNVSADEKGLHVKGAVLDLANPVAQQVHALMKQRRVKEFSFGYDPTEFEMDGDVRHLSAVDLWELGPTLKGANPLTSLDAIKGRRSPQDAPGSTKHDPATPDTPDDPAPVTDDPDASGDDDMGEDKAAIGPHSTATSDDPWDGPGAWAAINATTANLRGACAWVDPDGDPETQAAYKFIHHFIGSNGAPGAASTRGCTASVAILNGGRGGSTIPTADRQGVYNHVRKHLADAGVDPIPELAALEPDDDDLKEFADITKALKVGRVLSAKNESDIRSARDLLTKVLASLNNGEDDADKGKREERSGRKREDPKPKSLDRVAYELQLMELEGDMP